MGTFTKSFGSVGGYIAGDKVRRDTVEVFILSSLSNSPPLVQALIRYLRQTSYASIYEDSMSLPCAQMIISALDLITGADGTDRGQKRFVTIITHLFQSWSMLI